MEDLKQITIISNDNNISKFKITTNKRVIIILLPYTIITYDKHDKYVYKTSIIDKIKSCGIYTDKYLYKDWQY